jgi:hypothetical protein
MPASTVNPVTLPPGRARLAASPSATGSEVTVTIGIVVVVARNAAAILPEPAKTTSGLRPSTSRAASG